MHKLAIIGASYLQLPLILKAKEMGYETHVFAWKSNDVGEKAADYFYPISIVEKEEILAKCIEIGIEGICSIASDLAIITVNYVAQNMGLVSNDMECTLRSTNKHLMRKCFEENGIPSPKSILVSSIKDIDLNVLSFPVIVKPLDRSGSRGITKLSSAEGLMCAIEKAKKEGFEKNALVEEFVEGNEYSVECISYKGKHHFLQMTYKYTTGSPSFIETGHLEPAPVSETIKEDVKKITFKALDALGIKYGASHSEMKIDKNENIKIIEIGGRMGGDFIGSNLVKNSTGYDFVKAIIDISVGKEPNIVISSNNYSAIRYVFNKSDIEAFEEIKINNPDILCENEISYNIDEMITDSSNRHGYYITKSANKCLIYKYLLSIPNEI